MEESQLVSFFVFFFIRYVETVRAIVVPYFVFTVAYCVYVKQFFYLFLYLFLFLAKWRKWTKVKKIPLGHLNSNYDSL